LETHTLGRPSRVARRLLLRRLWQALSLVLFCVLLFHVAWPYADQFSARLLAEKEFVPAEIYLYADPLTSLTTSIAGRYPGISLIGLAAVFVASLIWPRGFCAYVCPLGTAVDLFDWAIGSRMRRFSLSTRGAWANTKYWLLTATLVAALFGVLLSGFFAAIPVATRGFVLLLGSAQLGLQKNWGMVRPPSVEYVLSVLLFLSILGLGLLGRRFWCRYVCPSGATFSLFSLFRLREREVSDSCISCGKCLEVCPFDAINGDFSTRPLDCALCGACRDACPVGAIAHVGRTRSAPVQAIGRPAGRVESRRELLLAAGAGALSAAAIRLGWLDLFVKKRRFLRPPGSVREEQFLDLCIRCGECFKVCPGPVLHPAGIEGGVEALWTPVAVPSWAGCHQDCNFCGEVCPTGAIRPLAIEEKRKTHMGLAVVDTRTCLPHRGEQDCDLCFQECQAAGYSAIEMREITLETGDLSGSGLSALDIEEAGRILAPFVERDACVGCGLCEYRCHTVWVKQRQALEESAVLAVPENEDRA